MLFGTQIAYKESSPQTCFPNSSIWSRILGLQQMHPYVSPTQAMCDLCGLANDKCPKP